MTNKNLFVLTFAIFLFVASVLIVSPGTVTGFLTRTGQFTLGNSAPTIEAIYLNGLQTTTTPTDATITGVENATKAITIKITVRDDNGDCDQFTNNNAEAFFCSGTGLCDYDNYKHYVYDLNYDAGDGQWGVGGVYCNLTGITPENWQFYEVNGTWNVSVNMFDGTDYASPLSKLWYYNEIRGISYPSSGSVINLGALDMDSWNNGTGRALMQNSGNIISDLAWNATDFAGQVYNDPFAIDGTNFIIDDDALSPDAEVTYYDERIDDTTNYFYSYTSGAVTIPAPGDGTWVVSSAQTELASNDGSFKTTVRGSAVEQSAGIYQLFAFNVSNYSTSISSANVTYVGYYTLPSAITHGLYIWNGATNSWDLLTPITTTNTSYTIQLTGSQASGGLFNGYLYLAASATNGFNQGGGMVYSDYIDLDYVSTSLSETFINTNPTTTVNFYPAAGLLNCSSVACGNTNATMNVYWHLDLPSGLHSDTYTDAIQVTTSDHV